MQSILAVASHTRDMNALCSAYVDTTKATSPLGCLPEIAYQFENNHIVGESEVIAALQNPTHPLRFVLHNEMLNAAITLCSTSDLLYIQSRPWINFFNTATAGCSPYILSRHADHAVVGKAKFQPDLTKASTPSGIRVRIGTKAASKDLYLEGEAEVKGDSPILDLIHQVKALDLQCLTSSGVGLLMNVNGCRTLVTGDNLVEFGKSDDLETQRWQKAVTDRLTAALKEITVDSADPDLRLNCATSGTVTFAVWFESDLPPNAN